MMLSAPSRSTTVTTSAPSPLGLYQVFLARGASTTGPKMSQSMNVFASMSGTCSPLSSARSESHTERPRIVGAASSSTVASGLARSLPLRHSLTSRKIPRSLLRGG